jgi:prevent-host-death family protein
MLTTIMTTSVGIRELKRDGARLVQRAARGEHIEITRYGKPAARLVPIGSEDRPSAKNDAWSRERAAFERLEPRLRRARMGRWVAVQGGRAVAEGSDPEKLARKMLRGGTNKPFFIGRVGALPELVEIPGFEILR